MSDNIRNSNDNLDVDPRLDALLSHALRRGSVPRQQRQRHLERLGLAPRLGGSAGTWRAPVVAGRPPSSSAPTPESLPARRRRRQWLELGAAVLAVVLVGALLVAVFRDWSGGEDDQQLAASPEATTPPPIATPRETREQLYVVSHAMRQAQDAIIPEGRVSAIDPETGEEFWSVEVGPRIDAVLSPDGRRLFVASSEGDGDFVYALDTQTGRELWRQPIENRQWHKPGSGQSMLSVSPDGATLSVYSCEGCTGEFRSTDGRNWLAQFDAVTGRRLPDLDIPVCRGSAWLAPDGPGFRPLFVMCDRGGRGSQLEIYNVDDGQRVELTYDVFLEGGFPETSYVMAWTVSPDGRLLYLANGDRLTVIDTARLVATRVQLDSDVDIRNLNVERRLPLMTLSPDSDRLFVGSLDTEAFGAGSAVVSQIDVFDPVTWQHVGQIEAAPPLNGTSFTGAIDGGAVYGVSIDYRPNNELMPESVIQRLRLDGEPETVVTRTNEEVLFLFAGTVEVDPDIIPVPPPPPEPAVRERLFAVSHLLTPAGDAVTSGRVTAYDAETGEIAYWIDTGTNPDATLSPDGTRLFIAANSEDGDTLSSYDAVSGDRNWSVPIEHRLISQFGEGPTALAVSQDGSRLFVYSASAPGDYTIQVFDTADGRLGRAIDGVAGCTAQLFPSADGRSLYVVCLAERFATQVIDLEAWTSAGVMQGFSGVIIGAAASPDGRYLYIPHDIDSELRLTVVDMNARTISTQRDIVHMDRDPLHSLNITAVSPDGLRLFIGLGSEPEGEAPVADQIWAWDTANLHHDPQQMNAPEPINGWSLAAAPDNSSVFAIHNQEGLDAGGQPSNEAVIMLLGGETGSEEFVRYWGGDILRLFSGRVTDTPEPPSADEPEHNLPDLTVPDDLPMGLTLSSRLNTDGERERLIFTGDDSRVVQISVRRWTDGEELDLRDVSMPVQVGNLTVNLTADPEADWPRFALWHDSRFVYNLSVLSGPPDGWTQDDLLTIVTAFSSPASAPVCPSATWVGPESWRLGSLESYWIDGESLTLGQLDGRLIEGANKVTFITAPTNQIADPDPNARVAVRGTRLFTDYAQSVPLQLLDQRIEWNVPAGDELEIHIHSTVIFPSSGCWQIEAEFGTNWLRATVNVESDTTAFDPDDVWDVLRWRPLHEMGFDATPPCLRMPAQQVIDDFGPLVGDVEANGGPVYLNGPGEDGAIEVAGTPLEDGGYYTRVMFVTGGDYTGPMLVRSAPGSGQIGFTLEGPDASPAGEWHLQDPAGTSPTGGVRHWIVYLRFDSPGCHALQIDGLDFTSIIVFEVVADGP